jgi:50S ribosomal subunit-associated GTPase HflX
VEIVNGVLGTLPLDGTTVLHVFNKMDLVPESQAFRERARAEYPQALCIAAARGDVAELEASLSTLTRTHPGSPPDRRLVG